MATKHRRKKTAHKKRPKRRKVKRSVVRKTFVQIGKAKTRSTRSKGIAHAKKKIRSDAEERLKDGLYLRDCATTRKQHNAAQRKIDKARSDLRHYK